MFKREEKRLSALYCLKIVRALKSCKTSDQDIIFFDFFKAYHHTK
jgi:hypothetical protein